MSVAMCLYTWVNGYGLKWMCLLLTARSQEPDSGHSDNMLCSEKKNKTTASFRGEKKKIGVEPEANNNTVGLQFRGPEVGSGRGIDPKHPHSFPPESRTSSQPKAHLPQGEKMETK